MLCILRIGYHDFLLPSETGVTTIMRALSKATRIDDDKRYRGGGLELDQRPVEVKLELLPGWKLTKRPRTDEQVLEPEVLPPSRKALPTPRRYQLPMHLED